MEQTTLESKSNTTAVVETEELVFPSLDEIRQRFEESEKKLMDNVKRAIQQELHWAMTQPEFASDFVFRTTAVNEKVARLGRNITLTSAQGSKLILSAIEEKGLHVKNAFVGGFYLRLPTKTEQDEWQRQQMGVEASVENT